MFFILAAVSVASLFVIHALYQLFVSPLRGIPGPWYAAVSPLWATSHVFRSRLCRMIDESFDRYGPVVRIGPNKVVFHDVNAAKEVYGATLKFPKSSFYKAFRMHGLDYTFTISEHEAHAARRRLVSPHYAHSNLSAFADQYRSTMETLVCALVTRHEEGLAVDALVLFRHVMADISFLTIFGEQAGPRALSTWMASEKEHITTAIHDLPMCSVIKEAVPGWVWVLVSRLPIRRWRDFCVADKLFYDIALRYLNRLASEERSNEGKDDSERLRGTSGQSLLRRLYHHKISTQGSSHVLTDSEIAAECAAHIVAGTDTTSTSLSYLCWELGRRPDILKKLRAELEPLRSAAGTTETPSESRMFEYMALREMPYLNAFVKEGLRLYGAAPSLLERIVPPESTSGYFEILGHSLPPGTNVSSLAWSVHRDAAIFSFPEVFDPDRWLDRENEYDGGAQKRNGSFMPFGTGPRICVGANLAGTMLRLVIAVIATRFDVVVPSETTEASMEIRDSWIIHPASGRCALEFRPRNGRPGGVSADAL